jgi:mannosyltransferase
MTEEEPKPLRDLLLLALAVLIVVGAIIRFTGLDAAGLWLDEILAVLRSQSSPLSTSWTPGPDPQHGPLYHGVLALAGHFAPDETGYRFAFALAGTLSLPLLYVLARRVVDAPAALLATAFVTFAPIHIFHSQDARPYTILLLELLAGLLAVINSLEQPAGWRWYGLLLGMLAALLLTSSQGWWFALMLLASYGVAIIAVHRTIGWTRGIMRLAGASLLVVILFPALYGPLIAHQPDVIGPPPFSLDFAARMFQPLVSGFSEQQPATWMIYPALVLALVGAVMVIRARPAAGAIILLSFVLGYVLPLIALYMVGHGVRARYALAALPGLAILGSAACVGLLRPLLRLLTFRRTSLAAYASAVLVIAASILLWRVQEPMVRQAFGSRANWRAVAKLIQDRAHDGDLVIASNGWAQVCLGYYFPKLGVNVDLEAADESVDKAARLAKSRGIAFLVSGGWHATRNILDWIGQYHEIYESRNETIGVFFYPDRTTYMVERPPKTQLRRDEQVLWGPLDGHVVPGENGSRFLLGGWSALEMGRDGQQFRWVDGPRADVYLPSIDKRPRTLHFEAHAFSPIATRQHLVIKLNGGIVYTSALDGAWKDVDVDVANAPWRNGSNQLSLELAVNASPRETMPGATDDRRLSAAFRVLTFR